MLYRISIAVLILVVIFGIYQCIKWLNKKIAIANQKQVVREQQQAEEVRQAEELRTEEVRQAEELRKQDEQKEIELKKALSLKRLEKMLSIDTEVIAQQSGVTVDEVEKELDYPSAWKKLYATKDDLQELLKVRYQGSDSVFVSIWEQFLRTAIDKSSWAELRKCGRSLKRAKRFEGFTERFMSEALNAEDLDFFCWFDADGAKEKFDEVVRRKVQKAGISWEDLCYIIYQIPECAKRNGNNPPCTCDASSIVYQAMERALAIKVTQAQNLKDLEHVHIPALNAERYYGHCERNVIDLNRTLRETKETLTKKAIREAAEVETQQ